MKFRQKLLEINAIQNTGNNLEEITKFITSQVPPDSLELDENGAPIFELSYDENKNILDVDSLVILEFNSWIAFEDGEFVNYTDENLHYLYEVVK